MPTKRAVFGFFDKVHLIWLKICRYFESSSSSKTRKRIFQGKEIIVTENLPKKDALKAYVYLKKRPLETAPFKAVVNKLGGKIKTESITPRPFQGGQCLGAVSHFLSLAHQIGPEEAAQHFKGGLPFQAGIYQTMYNEFFAESFTTSATLFCFLLSGLKLEKKMIPSCEISSEELLKQISLLDPGHYYLSLSAQYNDQGISTLAHATGIIMEEDRTCYFLEPNLAIGKFENQTELQAVISRTIDLYGRSTVSTRDEQTAKQVKSSFINRTFKNETVNIKPKYQLYRIEQLRWRTLGSGEIPVS